MRRVQIEYGHYRAAILRYNYPFREDEIHHRRTGPREFMPAFAAQPERRQVKPAVDALFLEDGGEFGTAGRQFADCAVEIDVGDQPTPRRCGASCSRP